MKGLIFIVIAQLCWAGELVMVKKFFPQANPIFMLLVSSVVGILFYAPLFFLSGQKIENNNIVLLVALGLLSWIIPQILYVKGIQLAPNAFVATMTTLVMPLFSILLSAIFLKEAITWKFAVGGTFMIVGFIILSLV